MRKRLPTNEGRAYAALIGGLLAIGLSGIFVSWANAPGAVTAFYRMAIAILVLGLPFARRMQVHGRLPRREIAIALAAGAFFAADIVFWNSGVLISGAANPTLMGNTAPLWVGLGAMIFFHEKLSRRFWLGLVIALSGAAIILGLDAVNSVGLGTFFGLLAGIFYGAYFLVMQRSRRRLDAISSFWFAGLSATVLSLLFALALRQPLTGYSRFTILNFLALGIVVQALGQLAINYALGYLPASIVSPTLLGQPVLTAVFAVPLLAQPLTPGQIVGGVIVLAGVYTVHRSRMQSRSA